MSVSIRSARIEDCDQLGLITVPASHSAFIGVIPEECLDFSWPPEASARGWWKSFPECTDRGQSFRVLEAAERIVGFAWSSPWAETEGYDASVRGLWDRPATVDRFQTLEILFGWRDVSDLI